MEPAQTEYYGQVIDAHIYPQIQCGNEQCFGMLHTWKSTQQKNTLCYTLCNTGLHVFSKTHVVTHVQGVCYQMCVTHVYYGTLNPRESAEISDLTHEIESEITARLQIT